MASCAAQRLADHRQIEVIRSRPAPLLAKVADAAAPAGAALALTPD